MEADKSDIADNKVANKKPKQDEFFQILQKSEERDHEMKCKQLEIEQKRLEMQEKDLKIREERDAHQREMDIRRIKLDEQKMVNETKKTEAELHEKKLLMELLLNQRKM